MVNVSNTGYLDLRWPGLRQIGGDQGLLTSLGEPTGIVMGPGDRTEAEWLVGAEGFVVKNHPYSLNGGASHAEGVDFFEVIGVGDEAAPSPVDWPFSEEAPSPDPGNTDVVYVFAGSGHTGEWLMNGETYPDITVYEIPAGKAFIMEVRNISPTEHPFHLHGVEFEVLSANGVVPETKRIEDTLNVGIHQSVRLRVVADNPGDWMAHCHILPHAHGGMMSVIRFLE
jgi:FtsP/CotA-like multicopper oxidase with cupredoxin domain